MTPITERIKEIKAFLRKGIWEMEGEHLSRGRRVLLRHGRLVLLVGREFFADGCLMRASALTYATLLSIVPVFALTFAVLKGLGVQNTLQPLILERITVGSEEIVNQIVAYINNTNVGSLGTIGLVALIFTVVALLSNIETSFNMIWGVPETRSRWRRFSDYIAVLVIAPILLFVAISMTTTLQSQAFVQKLIELAYVGQVIYFLFKVLPYVAIWSALIFLYIFMPNTTVRFTSAIIGGVLAGTLWQLAQWVYVASQIGVSRYNAIYGTLAALPILMIWIYISWIIVLLGGEVAYVWQNLHIIRREIREEKVNIFSQEMVALTIMLMVVEGFYRGDRALGMDRIAEHLKLPPRLCREILGELVQLGFLSEVRGEEEEGYVYQPARPPEKVEVFEIIQALRGHGVTLERHEGIPEWERVQALESRIIDANSDALSGATLTDLLGEMQNGEGKELGAEASKT